MCQSINNKHHYQLSYYQSLSDTSWLPLLIGEGTERPLTPRQDPSHPPLKTSFFTLWLRLQDEWDTGVAGWGLLRKQNEKGEEKFNFTVRGKQMAPQGSEEALASIVLAELCARWNISLI